ncbi:DNA translocase FtsK [Bacillus carboniphilus]|uniref:DNA translocase FtsK n=1 Tax=Bacillus carboniphilus TaxID=86663 RepID=A0ABY9JVQ4_9BACI|nr:DNA translocase FtsK [Bacillus carboniphilus]WLR43489.1 DNA translocase FtsK [Bacillus carboniphilus]
MAKKKRKQRKKKGDWQVKLKFEIVGLILFCFSIISMANYGAVGSASVSLFRFFIGEWFILGIIYLFCLSIYLFWKKQKPIFITKKLSGVYLVIAAILLLSHIKLFDNLSNGGEFLSNSVVENTWSLFWMEMKGEISTPDLGGGMIGAILFAFSYFLFSAEGSRIVAIVALIIGGMLISGRSLGQFLYTVFKPFGAFLNNQWKAFFEDLKNFWTRIKEYKPKIEKKSSEKPVKMTDPTVDNENIEFMTVDVTAVDENPPIISSFADQAQPEETDDKNEKSKESTELPKQEITEVEQLTVSELENKDYQLPSLELLSSPSYNGQQADKQNIYENARKLEKTFHSFGVKAKVTQVHLGPAVTKYEVYPDVGVKVSKIVNLSDDLALALAAKDIRMEAPIPGKSAIGIEVPNSEIAMVSLREVIEVNTKHVSPLSIGLGRDITGGAVLAELNKMPHLLVAGATGSGKSVCINGIITSILMRAKPHQVKLMMIDPKMVELNVYNGIPHLLAPVVTNPKKASQALKKVVNEMERRYELFSHSGTRNIEGYNQYVRNMNQYEEESKQPELPYIVVIVDELADLMMVASSDVEDAITRLSQMARAAGIHLIIATQRPSVDVITGVIKANIPSRIAFSVSSQTDSRTILDMGGAEKLLGKGDMLFLPSGASKPVRVQGAFLSDEEVEKVVDHVIEQQKAQYQEEMIITGDVNEDVDEVTDELYDNAVQLVVEMQTASVSLLQRRFRIGYTRAARLIDEMEKRNVVGPYEGSKPRGVLITKDQYDQLSS